MSPLRSEFWLEDMFLEKWDSSAGPNSLLYLHGFPGLHPNNQNQQLAASLADEMLKIDVSILAPQYTGLGRSRGIFSFLKSFSDAQRATALMLKESKKISIVGYSWGGLVGSYIYSSIPEEQRDKLILLAPVTQLFSRDILKIIVSGWRDEYPDKLEAYQTDESLVQELVDIFQLYNPAEYLKDTNISKITVIHGDADAVIPKTCSEKFVSDIGLTPYNFKIFSGQGHDFSNRSKLFMEIRGALQNRC
jgi:esterase/lipase